MPLIHPQSQAEWDEHYTGGYTRRNAMLVTGFQLDVPPLVSALGLQPGETIVLMGCGFGFLGDALVAVGLGPVTCCDTNPHVQATKATEALLPILDEDGLTPTSQAAIGYHDWAITADPLPWLIDAECVALAEACRLLANNTAHWISCLGEGPDVFPPPQGNWKTAAQWKELLTPDLVVMRGTDMVL
jgi:hypothetical protein